VNIVNIIAKNDAGIFIKRKVALYQYSLMCTHKSKLVGLIYEGDFERSIPALSNRFFELEHGKVNFFISMKINNRQYRLSVDMYHDFDRNFVSILQPMS
jgi:hypothetical protein